MRQVIALVLAAALMLGVTVALGLPPSRCSTSWYSPLFHPRPAVPVVATRPVVYTTPTIYIAPAQAVAVKPLSPPPMPMVIEYPHGRYELRGDGTTTPYQWVCIPNPPPPPAASPPPDIR